jgi:hypothetical protein
MRNVYTAKGIFAVYTGAMNNDAAISDLASDPK